MNKYFNIKPHFFVVPIILLLSCCVGLNSEKHIVGRYYLRPTETSSGRSLIYKVDDDDNSLIIVKGDVLDAAYDHNYIILKQSPEYDMTFVRKGDSVVVDDSLSSKKIDLGNAVKYFIVPIYKEFTYSPEQGILGPLDLQEFNSRLKALKIKAIFNTN